MKFEKSYISGRFTIVVIIAIVAVGWILYNAVTTMVVEREKWQDIGNVSVSDTLPMKPMRGNILSADGRLMASSLPDYKLYVDFLSGGADKDSVVRAEKDSIWDANMDSICTGLSQICNVLTPQQYKEHLNKGRSKGSRYYEICPRQVLNYLQYKEIIKLPVFNMKNRNMSGLVVVPRNNRNKPFGSLARRTLGEMFGAKDSARSGIELAYDSVLRGKEGKKHHKKVFNKYLDIIDLEPEDGFDLVTTIDVSMQDICESALREKLEELNASMGVVVLMEVKTGDVKAIVNLQRYDDGNYYEARNYALASLMEPGSTFKTASMMVAIDDGYINKNTRIETGSGIYNMHGSFMKDHNWARGGYHNIDVTHCLKYSSNVGVSRLIDMHYHNQPEKFVEGLRRVGIGAPLGLPFVGGADPRIRTPHKDRKGGYTQSDNWSSTALAWMSIGYETQIPPISTVAFYNAIANNGKMVRPRFVKGISRNGELVEEYPVEVIKKQICKKTTLEQIQEILMRVVNDKDGTGKRAGNSSFHVSGKTGTAQIAGKGGYKGGKSEHLVSFCGYFPSEDPKYTCIVAIRHEYYVASGGGQAGPVFSKISQRVFSKNVTSDIRKAADSTSVFVPDVKTGNVAAASNVLKELNVKAMGDITADWATASIQGGNVNFSKLYYSDTAVPDLVGMGARDAIFALESRGMKARIKGRGKVTHQSVAPGGKINAGQVVQIELN
ncbi:MAG: transpeptidase family protein [Bacteroidaceae bacterium]|nr:transpeptidase family protein [Bacteroidaceae bacterium]